jgi:GDP-6-deoxy-D-talose 4-dehydrogenase
LNILLTGSDGFTGRHFADLARSMGHTVIPLLSDLTDKGALQREAAGMAPDAVMHFAAISFVGHSDDNSFYAVNVVGTMNLLAVLAQLPQVPRCVVLASSANVYGNCEASPVSEMEPPLPVSHYAMSKLAMEHMCRTYGDRLPLVIARPFNYTGPGQALNFVIPKLVDHFARVAAIVSLGNLNVEREFNDVRMVCKDYLGLLEYGEPGHTYNICSGRPYALQHVIKMLTGITGHPIEIVVNTSLVRSNEVTRLCGSPTKIEKLFMKHGVIREDWPLEDTLRRMLAVGASQVAQCVKAAP